MHPPPNNASSSSALASSSQAGAFQVQFHQRWNHLNDPHVRALAWLLDAPDLLDIHAAQWQGKIAHIAGTDDGDGHHQTARWLQALECEPEKRLALHTFIGTLSSTRLGLYAEKLMAFYFQQHHLLVAHGLQVRTDKGSTLGEFDFLLQQAAGLVHWEFATKFYLLEMRGAEPVADDFVGPNLSDSLGQKINKILHRQLILGQHPVAQSYLNAPVVSARALVKGWLFYPDQDFVVPGALGVSGQHCRGYWSALSLLMIDDTARYLILPRLRWLAPAKAARKDTLNAAETRDALEAHFSHDRSPLLLVTLRPSGGDELETTRGFVVPDDWATRAAEKRRLATIKVDKEV
ncbi:DUF1853 family protein [Glaciimonas sp. PCH181]|uniref:DUF1853 family protein n=1 Tax=Glaciimonas sp. PCH181 TaxID=2133943 RepID=UPI000D3C1A94|nr:DUF1853 family protein [Glaciimonas sp. PCH181]PUA18526.1 DUF1853 domain-containing protein [Glaciimonas sp. PCH181]